MKEYKVEVLYTCPECDYLITETELKSAYYDYPCPRCNQARISTFEEADLLLENSK